MQMPRFALLEWSIGLRRAFRSILETSSSSMALGLSAL